MMEITTTVVAPYQNGYTDQQRAEIESVRIHHCLVVDGVPVDYYGYAISTRAYGMYNGYGYESEAAAREGARRFAVQNKFTGWAG